MLIDVEFHPVQARILYGPNSIIGADHGTHGAANAGIFNPGVLADTVKCIIIVTVLGIFTHRCFYDPFLERMKGNGLNRAHSRTLAAQGTPVIIIFDLPGQIIQT
jgi:hypothetical protein